MPPLKMALLDRSKAVNTATNREKSNYAREVNISVTRLSSWDNFRDSTSLLCYEEHVPSPAPKLSIMIVLDLRPITELVAVLVRAS